MPVSEKEIKDVKEGFKSLVEMQKVQFDYFKLMVILNMAFITALIALVKGVLESPKVVILIMLAFICFMVSLLFSLITLLTVGDIIIGLKATPFYMKVGKKEKVRKLKKDTLKAVHTFDVVQKIVNYSFGVGFLALFVFVVWNFWSLI